MLYGIASRVYAVIEWLWLGVRRTLTPAIQFVGESSTGVIDLQDAIGASFDALADTTHRVITKKELLLPSSPKEIERGCSTANSAKTNFNSSLKMEAKDNTYVLRINTIVDQSPDGGLYAASSVSVPTSSSESVKLNEDGSFKAVLALVNDVESSAPGGDTGEVKSDGNLLMAQEPATNGYHGNGHYQSEDTDEARSTSSASEVDSLEKNDLAIKSKSVSQHAAYFRNLVRNGYDEKDLNGDDNGSWYLNSKETVIEREIRLQREREEALAEERRLAQMNANMRNCQLNEYGGENGNEEREACESELADHSDVESVPEVVYPNRNIKVRPLVDEDEDDGPTYKVLKESPVEREIRQTLEREEELKRDKKMTSPPITNQMQDMPPLTNGHSKITKSTSFPSVTSRALDLLTPKSERSLQRKLATSRIQQEIEEHAQRELVLRAEGAIKKTSEDYVDGACLMNRINPVEENNNTLLTSSSSLPSTPDSEIISPSSPCQQNGGQCDNGDEGKIKSGGRLFIKNKSNCNSITNGITNGITTLPKPAVVKGAMQKFISSRGKLIPSLGSRQRSNSNGAFSVDSDEYELERNTTEIRPPMVPPSVRRVHRSVETKIQAELQQMKQREEELRLLRAKQFATSQPNLLHIGLDDEENGGIDDETNSVDGLKGLTARANSIPNLFDDSSLDSLDEQVTFKPSNRRRSALIAQWEQKIMQQNNTN